MSQMVEDGDDECAGSSQRQNFLKNTLSRTLITSYVMRRPNGTNII